MNSTDKKETFHHKKKLNLIQLFRGIAALLVVLAHGSLIFHENLQRAFLFDIFNFGGSGVDFFFVLSGFIILYVHHHYIGNSSKLKSFLIKRFVRIYPIYWVVLTGKLFASLGLSDSATPMINLIEVVKAYLLFPQDRIILSEYFLGVSWTLTYEVFFYLIFGLLIYLQPKFYLPIIGILLSGVILNFTNIVQVPENSVLLQFLFSPLHIEFILGCLAAYVVTQNKITYGSQLLYLGLFLYTLAAINTNYNLLPVSNVITYGIPATILVIGAVALEISKTVNVPQMLILLGDASYSIYLIHGFVINNLVKVVLNLQIIDFFTQNSLIFSLFAIFNAVMAVIIGCLMYLYLEKPLLSILRQSTKPQLSR